MRHRLGTQLAPTLGENCIPSQSSLPLSDHNHVPPAVLVPSRPPVACSLGRSAWGFNSSLSFSLSSLCCRSTRRTAMCTRNARMHAGSTHRTTLPLLPSLSLSFLSLSSSLSFGGRIEEEEFYQGTLPNLLSVSRRPSPSLTELVRIMRGSRRRLRLISSWVRTPASKRITK